nr:GTPase/DUF3482 domain-containing protein [Stenoxybacter acetivorans]
MNPLSLAVVGHTNTGKTSLLRTLLRDEGFGEVKNQAATTRHVEAATIHDGSTPLITLYDTPGLEDAGGVLDWLETQSAPRLDGIERIEAFLASVAAKQTFEQEAKVLRQLLQSDAALYVIDAREPILPKYKDELTVLSWCAKPIMPVFNFLSQGDTQAWQTMLARRSLHVSSGFDTVAFDFDSEMRLWANLATMLPERTIPELLMNVRQRDWQVLDGEARRLIAHFLLDAAAYQQEISNDDPPEPTLLHMRDAVRQLERQMQQQLLQQYRFYQETVAQTDWALKPFSQDPFDPELWKEYGIRTTSGAAAGALIGLGIDAAALGTSLGLGTAIGGILGGVLPNIHSISNTLTGRQVLHIDPAAITFLAARSMDLLAALQSRGHAAQHRIGIGNANTRPSHLPWTSNKLPPELQKARSQTKWSSLNTGNEEASRNARREAANRLAQDLILQET